MYCKPSRSLDFKCLFIALLWLAECSFIISKVFTYSSLKFFRTSSIVKWSMESKQKKHHLSDLTTSGRDVRIFHSWLLPRRRRTSVIIQRLKATLKLMVAIELDSSIQRYRMERNLASFKGELKAPQDSSLLRLRKTAGVCVLAWGPSLCMMKLKISKATLIYSESDLKISLMSSGAAVLISSVFR